MRALLFGSVGAAEYDRATPSRTRGIRRRKGLFIALTSGEMPPNAVSSSKRVAVAFHATTTGYAPQHHPPAIGDTAGRRGVAAARSYPPPRARPAPVALPREPRARHRGRARHARPRAAYRRDPPDCTPAQHRGRRGAQRSGARRRDGRRIAPDPRAARVRADTGAWRRTCCGHGSRGARARGRLRQPRHTAEGGDVHS